MITAEIKQKCEDQLKLTEKQKDRISKKIVKFINDDIKDLLGFANSSNAITDNTISKLYEKLLNSPFYNEISNRWNYEKLGKLFVYWKFSIVERKLFVFKKIVGCMKIDKKIYFFEKDFNLNIYTEEFFKSIRKHIFNVHPKNDYANLLKHFYEIGDEFKDVNS